MASHTISDENGEDTKDESTKKSRGMRLFISIMLLVCLAAALSIGLVLHFQKKEDTPLDRTAPLTDCHPDPGATEGSCKSRGCEWRTNIEKNAPRCVYKRSNSGYYVDTGNSSHVRLVRRGITSVLGMDVKERVTLFIETRGDNSLRLKFVPEGSTPYEVPTEALDMGPGAAPTLDVQYRVEIEHDPFVLKVIRNKTGTVVFESTVEGLVFADQFLQLTNTLPSNKMYGFGEHNHRRFQHDMDWKTWSIFTRDCGPIDAWNLYGAQPVHLNLEDDGNANIVFLKNSNAIEVTVQPSPFPAVTYRTIGGVLDFYMFLGPSPTQAISQYNKAVGLPVMPPYWELGFQLCRWHYGNLSHVEQVVKNNQFAGIPQDVQWGDIDYMYEKLSFTYDKETYKGLPEFVDKLHQQGMKYIVIVDPGVGNEEDKIRNATINSPGYTMYQDGMNRGVYINTSEWEILEGTVWPGRSTFPDFTNKASTLPWWIKWITFFRDTEGVKVDGLWVDMNEVSSFIPGSIDGCQKNNLNNPPYAPNILGRDKDNRMYDKTICMDARSGWGNQYDVHSLYGHSMSMITNMALKEVIPNKRPVVITRSNYVGTSHYAAHWLGDNQSRWPQLHWSIIGLMEYSIFGFPLVGADICGFWYEAQYEMCARWQQLGAFYPFSRNHNAHNDDGKPEFRDQDPAAWGGEFVQLVKPSLNTRYKLLPYLYTLMHRAHAYGETVTRPFMFEFPSDAVAAAVDRQFMWGSGLLITPVLDEGHRSVNAYFPKSMWYDYYTGEDVQSTGDWQTLDAPLNKINLHLQGGHVIPWQLPANNTVYSRLNDLGLIVAMDAQHKATGSLFWDDGETSDTFENGTYLSLAFNMHKSDQLEISVDHNGYSGAASLRINFIDIYGLSALPSLVKLDGVTLPLHKMGTSAKIIKLADLSMQLTTNHTITWSNF